MKDKGKAEDIELFRMMALDDVKEAQSAFGILFRKYRKWILSLLISKISAAEDCEEIANDLMLQLWERRKDLLDIVENVGVKNLLRLITKRKIVDYYRKALPAHILLELDGEGHLKEAEGRDAVDDTSVNDRQLILQTIERALTKERIPETDQRIFWDFINRVPIKDICKQSDYKSKTVYWKVKVMRKILQKYLRPFMKDYCLGMNAD